MDIYVNGNERSKTMSDDAGPTTEERVSREVSITRLFDAPRDLVFQSFTDAEHIARWWGPEGFSVPSCESDPREGGSLRIVMRGPDGTDHPMTGTYREFDPPRPVGGGVRRVGR